MKFFLFATHSNPNLSQKIIKKARWLRQGKCKISHYKDGEILVHIDEKVKGKKVFVLGSTFPPAENVLELIILINALKENGAQNIAVLIPYFGYGKQDRIKYSGDAMSAKLMAKIIEDAGANKIITLDFHSHRVEEYFEQTIKHLSAVGLLVDYFKKLKLGEVTIISPDQGGIKRAERFASMLGTKNFVVIDKFRPQVDQSKIIKIYGEVKNQNCVIVDDMTQTGGTLIETAKILKQKGARDIYAVLTHLVATGPAVKNLKKDKLIKKIIFTNSVEAPEGLIKSKKFEMISCEELLVKNL
ncbi:hypothetical protein COV56_00430 [Candidatus Kuenenbacteria bacterium CG11_big_fil_rev_8_21_14_0_20_37_9]|uniref:ribose-phosphate diphosphokinase n=1 Tax=Candidatus Kuenenbacteria bacterium CG08_land_8_20_14_0_20_37_23 TaxID=1974617 RepID=A0A2M6XTL4_9BACT|nr:MAG: hypothetical protein COV56_00430 [Candidatus Kuenenbacteria bacterium CG11_big_fil_rev_8_21_14_0_20_37_9]PIU10977.1 MAG: hypothetical protein COT27_00335 [Candidatus Kuenenbacteria bacterium CG08_land_8_20_14_0_20_37_23]